jgi:hypothetical protein
MDVCFAMAGWCTAVAVSILWLFERIERANWKAKALALQRRIDWMLGRTDYGDENPGDYGGPCEGEVNA